MHDKLFDELRTVVNVPELIHHKIEACNGVENIIASPKQEIIFSTDQISRIVENYSDLIDHYLISNIDDYDYIRNLEPFQDNKNESISYYFGSNRKYIANLDTFMPINKEACRLIIFNGYNISCPISEIDMMIKKVLPIDYTEYIRNTSIPDFRELNVTKFNGNRYEPLTRIPSYMYRFPTLCTNLPYEYYSTQNIPEHILTYDVNSGLINISGRSIEEIKRLIKNIIEDGIQEPLFFQISGGTLVSADDDTYMVLLLAKIIGIPSIPVVLYMMNNEYKELLSERFIDIMNRSVNFVPGNKKIYDLISDICYPYFIFYNKEFRQEFDDLTHKIRYRSDKDILSGIDKYDNIDYSIINYGEFESLSILGSNKVSDVITQVNGEIDDNSIEVHKELLGSVRIPSELKF